MQARAPADANNRLTVITINNTINLMLTSIKFSDFIKIAKNRKIKYAKTIASLRYTVVPQLRAVVHHATVYIPPMQRYLSMESEVHPW